MSASEAGYSAHSIHRLLVKLTLSVEAEGGRCTVIKQFMEICIATKSPRGLRSRKGVAVDWKSVCLEVPWKGPRTWGSQDF